MKRLGDISAIGPERRRSVRERASVLVIVLWVSFGLVSIALYFGHSMFFEFRAADNNAAGVEAEHIIEGASRYLSYFLTNAVELGEIEAGTMPDLRSYRSEEVVLGDGIFWLIGRGEQQLQADTPVFGLVDEASKLNLNTATVDMLQALPRMTPQLAAAIIDWRDTNSDVTAIGTISGAEAETYSRLNPPYNCKNADFESVEELRLVYGATAEILIGEDYNRNGILDLNENDADLTPPLDNRDGRLDPGLLEYLTVYSRELNTRTNGEARININDTNRTSLTQLLQDKFQQERANQIVQQIGGAGGQTTPTQFGSLLHFYVQSRMTAEEFTQVEGDLTMTNATSIRGLINVNTASAAVLACVPGIGSTNAPQVISYRQSQGENLRGMGWLTEVLDQASVLQAGPYLTSHSYQFTADVAAVGHFGRGYRRVQFILDTSEGGVKIRNRRDLSRLGWVLGPVVRERLAQQSELITRKL